MINTKYKTWHKKKNKRFATNVIKENEKYDLLSVLSRICVALWHLCIGAYRLTQFENFFYSIV